MSEALAKHVFTSAELLDMLKHGVLGESKRFELFDGEIVEMPTTGWGHGWASSFLDELLRQKISREMGHIFTETTLPLSDTYLFQPDYFILKPGPYPEDPTIEDVLLVIEVSDSTLERDRAKKIPRYALAGIPEVWIVNVQARSVLVFRNPEGSSYSATYPEVRVGTISPSAFPEVKISVPEIFQGIRENKD